MFLPQREQVKLASCVGTIATCNIFQGMVCDASMSALQAILDDQIVKTQSMRASPFIKPLEKEALEWDETLNRLQEVVDNWLACQATWQYLEPIFTSPDIMKQMPEEGDKFLQVQPLNL